MLPPSGTPVWTPAPVAWRPPVPDPLPPAPLLVPSWKGIATFVLGQIWGALNPPPLQWRVAQQLAYNKPGIYAFTIERHSTISGKLCADGSNYFDSWSSSDVIRFGTASNKVLSIQMGASGTDVALVCSGDDGPPIYGISGSVSTEQDPDGSTFTLEPASNPSRSGIEGGKTVEIAVVSATVNGEALKVPKAFIPVPKPPIKPEPEVLPDKRPRVVPLVPAPAPAPRPTPAEPSPVQPEPGPAPAPKVLPSMPPKPTTTTGRVWQRVSNGSLEQPAPAPVRTTNPTAVFPIPGGVGIPGNGPQPNLDSMAQELGRIEQKLHQLLNPIDKAPDWIELLRAIYELLNSVWNKKTYTLTEYCNPTGDPDYEPPHWDFVAEGANTLPGVLLNRIDALALMLDQTVRVKQQICEPVRHRPQGALVTVNFIAAEKPQGSSAYLRKYLRYRDLNGLPEARHVEHWLDFVWDAGPAIVTSRGLPWGVVQVWAADPEEGRRVIAHAAAIAGVDLKDKRHRWEDSAPGSSRYGRSGRMAVERDQTGVPCVSKRDGSGGRPSWALAP